jgi:hypothetical protein
MIHPFHKCKTCDFQRTLTWFISFVLFLVGVGAPFYMLERAEGKRRQAEADRRWLDALERQSDETRRKELEDRLRSEPSAGQIRGPRTSNPFASLASQPGAPRNPYEYLPAEQQRMLRGIRNTQPVGVPNAPRDARRSR